MLATAQGHAPTSAPGPVPDSGSCGAGWQPWVSLAQSTSQLETGAEPPSHMHTTGQQNSAAGIQPCRSKHLTVFTVRKRLRLFPCLPLSSYRHHLARTKVHRRSGSGRAGPSHGWACDIRLQRDCGGSEGSGAEPWCGARTLEAPGAAPGVTSPLGSGPFCAPGQERLGREWRHPGAVSCPPRAPRKAAARVGEGSGGGAGAPR